MAKQVTDDEDALKRRARRRLIGAVALTTAVVVVLPMVLDSEPKPVGQDIELRIPDKDKAPDFAPKMEAPPSGVPAAVLPASPVAASAPVAASSPEPQAVAPLHVAAPVAAIASSQAASSPAKTVEPVPEHKTDQPKRDAKPAGKAHTEQQGQAVPHSGFVVQIGAFGNPDTAHSWTKNLNSQGFKAYTEKIGNKTRVRIGPYATREAANKARRKLETKGLHSNIVGLD